MGSGKLARVSIPTLSTNFPIFTNFFYRFLPVTVSAQTSRASLPVWFLFKLFSLKDIERYLDDDDRSRRGTWNVDGEVKSIEKSNLPHSLDTLVCGRTSIGSLTSLFDYTEVSRITG